jgi:hypothetical protein
MGMGHKHTCSMCHRIPIHSKLLLLPPPPAPSQKRSKIMTPEKVKATKIVAALGLLTVGMQKLF